ncbi:MAG: hypothetical protein ACLFNI_01095 [Natronomonas sp.]
MTTVAVLVDPPRSGHVMTRLVETSPLSPDDALDLYVACSRDVVSAALDSGGELLVNYGTIPSAGLDDEAAEAAVREILEDVVPKDTRYEVQVGETRAARAGNTATHLLETEGVGSVAIVDPSAAFLARTDVDGAAMKLRSSEVVLGPAPGGRIYYAGFTEPVDFAEAFAPPTIETLVDRSLDAGLDVDFLDRKPVIGTGTDLADAVSLLRARRRADRLVPDYLAEWIEDANLRVEATDDGLSIHR